MVTRICGECNEAFHPYTKEDFVCDSCVDALNTSECVICGFDTKDGEVCKNCLDDENLEREEQNDAE